MTGAHNEKRATLKFSACFHSLLSPYGSISTSKYRKKHTERIENMKNVTYTCTETFNAAGFILHNVGYDMSCCHLSLFISSVNIVTCICLTL